jgi:hypothetical protein
MGKSSKNFKRPTKKEKDQIKLKKSFAPSTTNEPSDEPSLNTKTKSTIAKKGQDQDIKKNLEKFANELKKEEAKVVSKHEEHQEKKEEPAVKKDYVDLMFGKKTYKPLFAKK